MNQIIQYLLLFGVTGIFFVALYAETIDDIGRSSLSMEERVELYKQQAGEDVAFIDVQKSGSNLIVTVIGTGTEANLTKFFVDGEEPNNVECTDVDDNMVSPCLLPPGEIRNVKIEPARPFTDPEVTFVTAYGRVFTFP